MCLHFERIFTTLQTAIKPNITEGMTIIMPGIEPFVRDISAILIANCVEQPYAIANLLY
jgi:hypothetical protein